MRLRLIGAGFGRTRTIATCMALGPVDFPSDHLTEGLTQGRQRVAEYAARRGESHATTYCRYSTQYGCRCHSAVPGCSTTVAVARTVCNGA